MEKREELYRGKAKSVYKTDDANRLILLFRNDTSAFDGKRIEQLDRKGMVNNKFNAFIMQNSKRPAFRPNSTNCWAITSAWSRSST